MVKAGQKPRRGKAPPSERRAALLHRSLRAVEALDGPLVADAQGLWLLPLEGLPEGESSGTGRRWRLSEGVLTSDDLAAALLAPTLPSAQGMAELLGSAAPVRLDDRQLARWSRHLTRLREARDLPSLIAQGVRKLRAFRQRPLAQELERKWRHLEECRAGLSAWLCRQKQVGVPSPEDLGRVLDARLRWLADWSKDPALELALHGDGAPRALEWISHHGETAEVRALAVVLLARRHRELRSLGSSVGRGLEPRLGQLFDRVARHGAFAPVLEALAFVAGRPPLPVASVPVELRFQLCRAAERVAVLLGTGAALESVAHLSEPFVTPVEQGRRREARCQRFEALARGAVAGEEKKWAKAMARLRRRNAGWGRNRSLVTLFVDWCQELEPEIWRSRTSLIGLVRDERSLGRAGARLGQAWCEAATAAAPPVDRPAPALMSLRLRTSWIFPAAELRIERPPNEAQRFLELLVTITRGPGDLGTPESRELAELLLRIGITPGLYLEGAEKWVNRPLPLLRRAFDHGVLNTSEELGDEGLRRYLDCLDRFEAGELEAPFRHESWFVRLFDEARSWHSAVALATVATGRSGIADPVGLLSLSYALYGRSSHLTSALDAWVEVEVVQEPPELAALVDLGLSAEKLRRFLHYRRLCGEGERFSSALLAPLQETDKLAGQTAFLRGRIEAEPGSAELARALARLERRLAEGPSLKGISMASRTLERSLENLQRRSLELALDHACRLSASQMLGRALPDELPKGFRDAYHLMAQDASDLELVRSFLLDVLAGRPLEDRPANRRWLEQARAAGVDIELWIAGPSFTVEVGGQTVHFVAENDPLHVLRMGSYFDTCLDIERGFNAASTLTNALDINKRVLYGRTEDGTVVGRKLIACTAEGHFVGYRTYGRVGGRRLGPPVSQALQRFAEFCGLHPDDHATPENLHGAFWYDDGNELWLRAGRSLPPYPETLPQDPEARLEWHLEHAEAEGDPEGLSFVSRSDSDTESALRAGFLRLLAAPGRSAGSPSLQAQEFGEHSFIQALGEEESGPLRFRKGSPEPDPNYLPVAYLSCLGAPGGRDVTYARQALALDPPDSVDNVGPRYALAQLPPELAAPLLDRVAGTVAETGLVDEKPSRFLWILATGYLLAPDRRVWIRHMQGHRHPREGLLRLAEWVPVPELRDALRRAVGEMGEPREQMALALARIAQPRDVALLLDLLRKEPTSPRLAAAVVRSGDADAAQEARDIWNPYPDALGVLSDRELHPFLRDLVSPKLIARLRRQLTRRIEAGEPVGEVLNTVAQFGDARLPPREIYGAAMEDLKWNRPANRAHGVWEKAQAVRRAQGSSPRRVLDELLRLSRRSTDAEVWSDLLAHEDAELALAGLTLIGREADALPRDLRRRIVAAILTAGDAKGSIEICSLAWRLTADLTVEDRADLLLGLSSNAHWSVGDSGHRWLILRVVEAGAETLETWLDVCGRSFSDRPNRCLRFIDRLIRWRADDSVLENVRLLLRGLPADACAHPWYLLVDEASYHLDQLLLEEVAPRLGTEAREKLVDELRDWDSERGDWILKGLASRSHASRDLAPLDTYQRQLRHP